MLTPVEVSQEVRRYLEAKGWKVPVVRVGTPIFEATCDMLVEYTHRIKRHKRDPIGGYFLAKLVDGILYTSEEFGRPAGHPCHAGGAREIHPKYRSVEEWYAATSYEVEKIKRFRGNK